ncbi:hypothetical protein RND71_006448 [Anisodus tanguticus]|uniref:Remorin C-terminal domain-containing protein n=1 Tax=Anisodus tanguticus TaxID=243964 RepID=A0AAE1SW48_9SOLA|nr:hypothetical protein RND71_006448 [Anisodus tanguticus]
MATGIKVRRHVVSISNHAVHSRILDIRTQKKLSAVLTWENKKANIEAKLKKYEEKLEQKKAEYAEKIKNRVAAVYKEADEKRAMVEARRGEDLLKVNTFKIQ